MRISDWSSDVCSSDLHHVAHAVLILHVPAEALDLRHRLVIDARIGKALDDDLQLIDAEREVRGDRVRVTIEARIGAQLGHTFGGVADAHLVHLRSEEHTSELTSPMRISYAVFCFNKQ